MAIRSFLLSMLVHGAIGAALFGLSMLDDGAAPPKRFAVIVLPPIKQPLYWVPAAKALPPISSRVGETDAFRGKMVSPRNTVVVQQDNAVSRKQMVWHPEKAPDPPKETPSPDMIALRGKPKPSPPPAPASAPPPPPPEPLKIKPKAFVPPTQQPALALPPPTLSEPVPELATSPTSISELRSVVVPGKMQKVGAPLPKLSSQKPGQGQKTSLDVPPDVIQAGTGASISAAVIGLNSMPNAAAPLPSGSRAAAFSRAPVRGAPSGGTGGAGNVIPGVAIPGDRAPGATAVLSPPPPLGAPRGVIDVRIPPSASGMSAPLRPAARMLPRRIEAQFHDRIVYTLVIPKPNMPEYASNWTMWFAERVQSNISPIAMRAPVPIRKILREGPPGPPTGPDSWVQLTAVIGKDGKISSIVAIPGRYDSVAPQVARDLADWEFRPAALNGNAVDVEVVLEVPFRPR